MEVTHERTELYLMLVQYFTTVEHLSIDEAHTTVDRIYKWLMENDNG